jgi:hypothetical protein
MSQLHLLTSKASQFNFSGGTRFRLSPDWHWSIIEALKKQWPDARGARMEHPLRFAVLALLEQESATLADILPLFVDKEFRKAAVAASPEGQVPHSGWSNTESSGTSSRRTRHVDRE